MGRIYVPVKVSHNQKSAYTIAFVDTGCDETVISEELAKSLRVPLKGKFEAISASNHLISGSYAEVGIETLNDSTFSSLKVGVTDVPFEENADEEGVDVILGVDFLQENGVKLSFRKGKAHK